MKNSIQTLTIAVATFALGLGLNSFAIGDMPANYKVAIVDINTVVAKSAQVQALKNEQLKKTEELQKWLNSAKADIAKQSTEANKQKLTKKYETTFAKKQENIKNEYAKKLANIDKNISTTIEKEAKAQNYDLVLPKGIVLYGGNDITEAISKEVK